MMLVIVDGVVRGHEGGFRIAKEGGGRSDPRPPRFRIYCTSVA
jgi:hypothetical protein